MKVPARAQHQNEPWFDNNFAVLEVERLTKRVNEALQGKQGPISKANSVPSPLAMYQPGKGFKTWTQRGTVDTNNSRQGNNNQERARDQTPVVAAEWRE